MISYMAFADDLVLMAQTKEGLKVNIGLPKKS